MKYHEITWTTEEISSFFQLINYVKLYHIVPLYLLNNDKDGQTKGFKPQEPHLHKAGWRKIVLTNLENHTSTMGEEWMQTSDVYQEYK